jgi:hypothetical protein
MSTELKTLRALWEMAPEPSQETRADARARLFDEIDREQGSVLRRTPPARPNRRLSRRRFGVLFASVVVVFVLVLGVASAFGLGLPLLDFGQAEKASPESRVVKNFAVLDQGAPPGMATDVIPNETRKVATFGDQALWVAPTREGGFCTDLAGEGGCDRLGTVPLSISWSIEQSGTSPLSQKSFGGLPVVDRVAGFVNARWSDSLEIRFEDGDVVKPPVVWVSKPIEAGFFVQAIPTTHRQPGHLISAAVALDRDGRLITSKSLDRNPSEGPPQDAILDQSRQLTVIETGDGPAVLHTAPTRYEGRCTWFEFGNETMSVVPCLPKGYEHQPGLALAVHSLGSKLILAGECGYSAIEFLHPDGSSRRVSCTDGLVFTELNPADGVGDVRALDADGRPLLGSTIPVPGLIQSR